MKIFYKLLENYKLYGVYIFLKLKFRLTKNIIIPKISHPIYLRKLTSDIPVFIQVFGYLEYNVPIQFEPKTIIDLGANVGLASIYFANKYPYSKIISIEPEESNFNVLKKNTAYYKNIIIQQKAISSIDNKNIEILDQGYGNWGFMTKINDDNQKIKSSIKTITIDKIMKIYNFNFIDILKIDIEGGEKELFESNFTNWIPVTKCIIIELHDGMKKGCSKSLFKCIANYNFSFRMKGENLVLINDDLKHIHNNC